MATDQATLDDVLADEAPGQRNVDLRAGTDVDALARAATTSGDSDSIACLTGAFLGAAHGMAAWPEEWAAQIEYADQLAALGRCWD